MTEARPVKIVDRHRKNNFDVIRMTAAAMVIVWHSATLTGNQKFDPIFNYTNGHNNLGHLGVAIFFITSGFLIAGAWERDPNIIRFTVNRILRVFQDYSAPSFFAL